MAKISDSLLLNVIVWAQELKPFVVKSNGRDGFYVASKDGIPRSDSNCDWLEASAVAFALNELSERDLP